MVRVETPRKPRNAGGPYGPGSLTSSLNLKEEDPCGSKVRVASMPSTKKLLGDIRMTSMVPRRSSTVMVLGGVSLGSTGNIEENVWSPPPKKASKIDQG